MPMPIMIKVEEAVPAPNSKNCDIKMEWFYKKVIADTDDPNIQNG